MTTTYKVRQRARSRQVPNAQPKEQATPLAAEDALLYRCDRCKMLRLSTQVLSEAELLHACPPRVGRSPSASSSSAPSSGVYALLARGSYHRLLGWAHSLAQGLDHPFKGV